MEPYRELAKKVIREKQLPSRFSNKEEALGQLTQVLKQMDEDRRLVRLLEPYLKMLDTVPAVPAVAVASSPAVSVPVEDVKVVAVASRPLPPRL